MSLLRALFEDLLLPEGETLSGSVHTTKIKLPTLEHGYRIAPKKQSFGGWFPRTWVGAVADHELVGAKVEFDVYRGGSVSKIEKGLHEHLQLRILRVQAGDGTQVVAKFNYLGDGGYCLDTPFRPNPVAPECFTFDFRGEAPSKERGYFVEAKVTPIWNRFRI